MPTNDVKKKYNDVLYWATSNQSKSKGYHLTRTQEAILRKLIHYSTSNPKITYSNEIIGEHTFIDSEVIRKEIPKIVKKGFLSSATITVSDNGEINKRRTIYVKWDFIQQILDDIPTNVAPKPIESTSQPYTESEELILDKKAEIETTQPKFELTKEKIDWILKLMENNGENITITTDDLLGIHQEVLIKVIYGENGYWEVDENTIENKQQWRLDSTSVSKSEVYNTLNFSQNMKVNLFDLEAFLEEKGMTFKDFDHSIYNDIMKNGLPKRELA
jgi:hypothetical protein